ncbi:substrate-binding periplasmic protein [Bdellovibrio svalbardensis]|uniref:Transporter substrate-binding domain-containing protein n=1 Tax=Bdellovibrio svalbardensis TaxID=2972972 RepID=A0ABT6DFC6_9BACT|nr:transporter substrate-binding domain-containing protein [Bdellovibrio svalbardensis]MDG0815543.1 transporter substrate-binding domain-containing protein [Bdellovibrio svalbardensis]
MSLIFLVMTATGGFSNNTHAAAPLRVVVYCDDAYQPYSYADKHRNPQGIYTEIMKRAFKEMKGYQVSIKPLPWPRAMKALEQREVFAVYPPYYRPLERPFIKDYSTPILKETVVVYALKDSANKNKRNWPGDWFGHTVGIFTGTMDIAGREFGEAVKNKKIKIQESNNNEQNLRNLITKKTDAYVNDRNAILYTLKTLKQHGEWPKNAPELEEVAVVSEEDGYLAFSMDDKKFPYKKDFIKEFNAAISKMKQNHEIEKITKDYLSKIDTAPDK